MTTANPRKRAVLYVRLSRSTDESTSIERQRKELLRLAEFEGWEVVDILEDDGESGGKRRAKADQALAMIRNNEADVLAVWKFDRWSRQGGSAVAELLDVIHEHQPRAQFVAHKDGIRSDSSSWRIHALIMGEMAFAEREAIRERAMNSMTHLSKVGRYRGGLIPFGWSAVPREDGPGYRLVLDDRAEVLCEAVHRVIAGETIAAIVRDFNESGMPSPEGKGWFDTGLRNLLRNPLLRGMVRYDGEVVRGDDGLPLRPNEPLIDDVTWYALQDALDKRSRPGAGGWNRESRHLLLDLARCAECGEKLHSRGGMLGCSQRGVKKCPGVQVSQARLEEYVEARFLAAYGDMAVYRELHVPGSGPELRAVEDALEEAMRKMRAVDPTDPEFDKIIERVRELKVRAAALESRPTRSQLVPTGKTYAEEWAAEEGVDRRRSLLADLIVEVRVSKGRRGPKGLDPRRVEITWAHQPKAA